MEKNSPPTGYATSPTSRLSDTITLDEHGTTLELPEHYPVENTPLVLTSDVDTTPVEPDQPKMRLTREKFLAILRQMLSSEQITASQANEMRRRFGITNASFHAKKTDAAKKKRKKKIAYRSKRINRLRASAKN